MAVAFEHVPARGREPRHLVGAVGERNLAVDGDPVIVPKHDQARQFLPPRQRERLLADALHQAAVARDHPCAVIHDLPAPPGAQELLGDGEAHRIGDALPQRAGRRLDPLGMAVFGMARGDRPQLAEVLHLLQRHVRGAGEVQERIEQHRTMARRQDEPVAIGPVRRGGVEAQVLLEQDRRDVRHAHRHPRMARIGGGHGIERQGADGGGAAPVVGMGGGEGGDVHACVFLWADLGSKRRVETAGRNGAARGRGTLRGDSR
jgi:hypothetical protein